MSAQYSARYALPLLVTAQAQKEITHNEALVLIDALLHPVVQERVSTPPVLEDDDTGKCWLVATSASGIWGGHDDEIACWIGGSWRYLSLPFGACVFDISSNSEWRQTPAGWLLAPEIADPSGGTVVDSQAREVIELLLEHFRTVGVVATGA